MNAQAVTLHFPLPLYDRLRRRAAETHRSVEDEILEVVAQGVPSTEDEISPELTAAISALQGLNERTLLTRTSRGDGGTPVSAEPLVRAGPFSGY